MPDCGAAAWSFQSVVPVTGWAIEAQNDQGQHKTKPGSLSWVPGSFLKSHGMFKLQLFQPSGEHPFKILHKSTVPSV